MTRVQELKQALNFADSYESLPLMLDFRYEVDPTLWLHLLGESWQYFDNVGLYLDDLIEALSDFWPKTPGPLHGMMTSEEQAAFHDLPDTLTIYRGCYGANKWGASWTLNREVAERFPYLHRYRMEGRPLLIKASIQKSTVSALKLERNEFEIVTFSRPKCISISTARDMAKEVKP